MTVKYAYYPGCSLEKTQRGYDESVRVVFKALGQEGQAALMAKRQRLIIDSRSMFITARPEMDVAPAPGYQAKLGVS